MMFEDREDAGRRLARALERHRGADVVVLGLPRGGVPVAFEVARALRAPLDVLCVRKLGVPFQPELAAGAVGEDGVVVVNPDVVAAARLGPAELDALQRRGAAELEEQVRRWRGVAPRQPLSGRIALVVDDGIATGATARAACQVARAHGAARVVLAVPVAAHQAVTALSQIADEVVCLDQPAEFWAVGQAYRHFGQTSDAEVTALLQAATWPSAATVREQTRRRDVAIPVTGADRPLAGLLDLPPDPVGIVAFAHGSGSSRLSPRNQQVAQVLGAAGLGTLLMDLLTAREDGDRRLVFDIGFLADRLAGACRWLRQQPGCTQLPLGLFGASTGAAAALTAAGDPLLRVSAVVSRGGRPDLAEQLPRVHTPTLLLVGGRDTEVLRLNRLAQRQLPDASLVVVPGATHLFEEPGTLEQVAVLARDWFLAHLAPGDRHGTAAG
ncbi:phosphoribosyltransferase family protein [Nocardioides panaciterrulae]|uniref:Putative phosphoribosyltransferase/dienelactone hydrolase n=1 Tax=Nocardioides panaciterrulae TaxID=661492 RepID=A0A7Y9J9J8_9ACTN|nr:phosphoribosyltransferase family protein [Nocardioides panaciterrulae]NYD40176.1 putative phosphoribosyltransferase/dienelactone hydrolase [Nocardioides panaciterrulae]